MYVLRIYNADGIDCGYLTTRMHNGHVVFRHDLLVVRKFNSRHVANDRRMRFNEAQRGKYEAVVVPYQDALDAHRSKR
jgi:hypothetical protein